MWTAATLRAKSYKQVQGIARKLGLKTRQKHEALCAAILAHTAASSAAVGDETNDASPSKPSVKAGLKTTDLLEPSNSESGNSESGNSESGNSESGNSESGNSESSSDKQGCKSTSATDLETTSTDVSPVLDQALNEQSATPTNSDVHTAAEQLGEHAVHQDGGSFAESPGSPQSTAASPTGDDTFSLEVKSAPGFIEMLGEHNTLDDVRARLKVLADRKKQREEAGLVTSDGRRLAEALMQTGFYWPAASELEPQLQNPSFAEPEVNPEERVAENQLAKSAGSPQSTAASQTGDGPVVLEAMGDTEAWSTYNTREQLDAATLAVTQQQGQLENEGLTPELKELSKQLTGMKWLSMSPVQGLSLGQTEADSEVRVADNQRANSNDDDLLQATQLALTTQAQSESSNTQTVDDGLDCPFPTMPNLQRSMSLVTLPYNDKLRLQATNKTTDRATDQFESDSEQTNQQPEQQGEMQSQTLHQLQPGQAELHSAPIATDPSTPRLQGSINQLQIREQCNRLESQLCTNAEQTAEQTLELQTSQQQPLSPQPLAVPEGHRVMIEAAADLPDFPSDVLGRVRVITELIGRLSDTQEARTNGFACEEDAEKLFTKLENIEFDLEDGSLDVKAAETKMLKLYPLIVNVLSFAIGTKMYRQFSDSSHERAEQALHAIVADETGISSHLTSITSTSRLMQLTDQTFTDQPISTNQLLADQPISTDQASTDQPVLTDQLFADQASTDQLVVADQLFADQASTDQPVLTDQLLADQASTDQPVLKDQVNDDIGSSQACNFGILQKDQVASSPPEIKHVCSAQHPPESGSQIRDRYGRVVCVLHNADTGRRRVVRGTTGGIVSVVAAAVK